MAISRSGVVVAAVISTSVACGREPAGPSPTPSALSAPANFSATVTGPTQALAFTVRLSWNPPATGPTPTGYQVELSTTGAFATFAPTRVSATQLNVDFPFPPRRTLSWRVRALDGAVEGPASTVATYTFALPAAQSSLPAPTPLSPPDRSVFDLFPRSTIVAWSAVAGAASYGFEVDYCQNSNAWCLDESAAEIMATSVHPPGPASIAGTSLTFTFIGAQPGRWTVWAIDGDGRMGARIPWQAFLYLR